jgi:hypothetical protein
MKTYVVTIVTTTDTLTHRVDSMSPLLAIRIAHQRATEENTLSEITEIACKLA